MGTHEILLTIQYITVSVLFAEIWIVFLGWKNSVHSYLFLSCIATFVSNIGYLFEMKAHTEDAYLTALKLSYAGREKLSDIEKMLTELDWDGIINKAGEAL